MLAVTVTELIHGKEVFGALAADWDTLARQGMTNTPFQTLAYQRGWWQHLQPENGTLHTIVVRQNDGRLTAIAPLYLVDGVLHFNGCVEETDYLDLITAAEDAKTAWTAVLDCLCSPEFPAWHALDLCNIPEASLTRQILPEVAEKRGFSFDESVQEVCPVIQLPATFDDYLAQIGSKHRREIKRKLRRAKGAEATLRLVGPDDDIAQEVDNFLELLQKSTFEKRDWLNDGRRALYHDTANAALANGTLQLLFIEVNGRQAAALFNFDYDGRIWVYNSGLDPVSFGNLSLGIVITAKAIESAIENGRTEFDFLRGNETYKYHFGGKDSTIYRHQISRKP